MKIVPPEEVSVLIYEYLQKVRNYLIRSLSSRARRSALVIILLNDLKQRHDGLNSIKELISQAGHFIGSTSFIDIKILQQQIHKMLDPAPAFGAALWNWLMSSSW